MSFTRYVAELDITPGRAHAPFWSAFIQVLRETMAHEAQQARGQSAQSMIRVSTSVTADRFTVTVEHDGPGPDWEPVRNACEALGGAVETESLEGASTRIGFAFPQQATAYKGPRGYPAAVRRSGKHGTSAA